MSNEISVAILGLTFLTNRQVQDNSSLNWENAFLSQIPEGFEDPLCLGTCFLHHSHLTASFSKPYEDSQVKHPGKYISDSFMSHHHALEVLVSSEKSWKAI